MIIDQLPTISDVQNSDELPIERGQTTYKTTVGKVVDAVSKIVADEYDNTSTYAVGDYCIHEGTLYVCNTDISTAEEWNATHWTATNVTDEIPSAYTGNPAMDGTASPGSTGQWADGGHVHPTDTTRAPIASPALTGTPTAPTAAAGTDTTQIATTAFVQDAKESVQSDLTSISATGSTNTTGATITAGTYFYLDGALVQAKTDIASGATFTSGTNYESVTAGALNKIPRFGIKSVKLSTPQTVSANNFIEVDTGIAGKNGIVCLPVYSPYNLLPCLFSYSSGTGSYHWTFKNIYNQSITIPTTESFRFYYVCN